MNKILKKILIIFMILFLFSAKSAFALECSDIEDEIKNYQTIKTDLTKVDCTNTTNADSVNKCNSLYLKKSLSLSNLYKMKENKTDCTSQIDKINIILDENKDDCSLILDGFVEKITKTMLTIFYILAPILVILFGSLDYTKAVVASNPDALKKATNNFIKRLVSMGLLFLSPAIVNIIINMNVSDYNLSGDGYTCKTEHINLSRTYNIEYISKSYDDSDSDEGSETSGSTTGSGGSTSKVTGDFTKWKQGSGDWAGIRIGSCGTVANCGCLLTATSIQVANSGAAKSKSFTPKTFVNAVKNNGGLTSGGGFKWQGWNSVAPTFKYKGQITSASGTSAKAKQLSEYINKGYYVVMEVKKGCIPNRQHWIAVLSVSGNDIKIADPGGNATSMKDLNAGGTKYGQCVLNSARSTALFKVEK